MNRRHVLHVVSWRGNWVWGRIGPHHLVIAGLLTLWVSLILAIDYPLLRETRQLAKQLASVPEPGRERPSTAKAAQAGPRQIAKEYAATLPAFDAYPGQLRALNLLADQHGVVVARVDYRYEPLTGLPIQRLVLRMDAQGQDLPLRSFLQAMLNAFPNLSIARLAYAKATDGSLKVDQALEIHLYYRWQAE
ncbi:MULTISPECIES: hypothetical protein [Cupriavidus]|uniref:hypothetical protein n=1 Tax=Cupriavidus TaxID=106589 RepID=UPI0012EAF75D|nr:MULTISPECIES: hypothetical protein [Cupriavidus]